jgi:hypothetical protein
MMLLAIRAEMVPWALGLHRRSDLNDSRHLPFGAAQGRGRG